MKYKYSKNILLDETTGHDLLKEASIFPLIKESINKTDFLTSICSDHGPALFTLTFFYRKPKI